MRSMIPSPGGAIQSSLGRQPQATFGKKSVSKPSGFDTQNERAGVFLASFLGLTPQATL